MRDLADVNVTTDVQGPLATGICMAERGGLWMRLCLPRLLEQYPNLDEHRLRFHLEEAFLRAEGYLFDRLEHYR